MGAKLWYLSCPAVSQISNFTVASFTASVCEKNAAPIVDSCYHKKHIISATQSPCFPTYKTHHTQKQLLSKVKTSNHHHTTTNRRKILFPTPHQNYLLRPTVIRTNAK